MEEPRENNTLRPSVRPDHPVDYCAGRCGKRLLRWAMFCNECKPDGWDEYNRDPEIVKAWLKRVKNKSMVRVGSTHKNN